MTAEDYGLARRMGHQLDPIHAVFWYLVLVRPGRFVTGKPRGDLRVIREGERGRVGHVARADLARFLVACAATNTYVREAVAVGS